MLKIFSKRLLMDNKTNKNPFVIVGHIDGVQSTALSYDGITWNVSPVKELIGSGYLECITKFRNKYIATVAGGNRQGIISQDGLNWNLYNFPSNLYGTGGRYLCNHNNRLVTTSYNRNVYYSDNGEDWIDTGFLSMSTEVPTVTISDSSVVCIPTNSSSSAQYTYSPDSINYSTKNMPVNTYWYYSAGNKKGHIMTGYNQVTRFSSDGISWVNTNVPTMGNTATPHCDNNMFFVTGGYNNECTLFTSLDGMSFKQATTFPDFPLYSGVRIFSNGNMYIATAYASCSTYYISDDGLTWTKQAFSTANFIRSGCA